MAGESAQFAVLALGLAVESTWPDRFWEWKALLWTIFVLAGGYVTWVWYRQ